MTIKPYKELVVWQHSISLVKEIYLATDKMPKIEQYVLISQMRRSAISIPSNIAEGYKRKNLKEYVYFLSIAEGSGAELETQIIIAKDLYPKINFAPAEALLEGVQKMLFALIKKLNPIPYVTSTSQKRTA